MWLRDRFNKVKHYYQPFKNDKMVNVGVVMGLIYPGSTMGIRENLYKGGPLGEMIQWTDILTAMNSFENIKWDFKIAPTFLIAAIFLFCAALSFEKHLKSNSRFANNLKCKKFGNLVSWSQSYHGYIWFYYYRYCWRAIYKSQSRFTIQARRWVQAKASFPIDAVNSGSWLADDHEALIWFAEAPLNQH